MAGSAQSALATARAWAAPRTVTPATMAGFTWLRGSALTGLTTSRVTAGTAAHRAPAPCAGIIRPPGLTEGGRLGGAVAAEPARWVASAMAFDVVAEVSATWVPQAARPSAAAPAARLSRARAGGPPGWLSRNVHAALRSAAGVSRALSGGLDRSVP